MMYFKHACSIGNYCNSAAYLNNLKIRKEALPFDWTFTTIDSTCKILDDDFEDFLNPKYYVDIYDYVPAHEGKQAGHTLYHKNFFNHKNPREKEDHDYYKRCVSRFRKFLKLPEPKLFICSYAANSSVRLNEDIKKEVFKLNDTLRNHTNNFRLLLHINYLSDKVKSKVTEEDTVIFFELDTVHGNHGLGYGNHQDNEEFLRVFNKLFKFDT